ncbi:hypothetical protein FACS1894208_02220 [Clostridia bacterium]|nr:hypothetical protein FACS1894208_02220 [Clostridia bacterium]
MAILPSLIMAVTGAALLALSEILPKQAAKRSTEKARSTAQAHTNPVYSYTSAKEALSAYVKAWESVEVGDTNVRQHAVQALSQMHAGVSSLEKMSSSASVIGDVHLLSDELGALRRADMELLRALSRFLEYCGSAAEYELSSAYFKQTCDKVSRAISETLELHARFRAAQVTNL